MERYGATVGARFALIGVLIALAEPIGHSCARGWILLIPLYGPMVVALTLFREAAASEQPKRWCVLVGFFVGFVFFAPLILWWIGATGAKCG